MPDDTKPQDENELNELQSGSGTEYPTDNVAESTPVEAMETEPEKKSRRGIFRKKEKDQEEESKPVTETTEETTTAMTAQDTDGYSTDRKETEESAKPEEEPENVEMKLWDVGKDQAETGSLKDLLDGSDEDLEEWKD